LKAARTSTWVGIVRGARELHAGQAELADDQEARQHKRVGSRVVGEVGEEKLVVGETNLL
jgi:hypothetical protein